MMDKIKAMWALFHIGQEVTNAAKWKSRQMTGTILGAVIVAAINLLKAFGYDIPIDAEAATQIGAAIVVVYNVVLTIVTSRRAGLPPPTGTPCTCGSHGPQELPPTVGRVDNTLY